jgi:hypothetical protein
MLKTLAKYWLWVVSTASSIIVLVHGLSQDSRLWIVIAFVALGFAGVMAWYERDRVAKREREEYDDEIDLYLQALAVEYMPLVEQVYTKHNRMAAIVASDDEIFNSVKREHPELKDEALKEAIRGWRARRERMIKPLSLS